MGNILTNHNIQIEQVQENQYNYSTFDEIIEDCKEYNNYIHFDEELTYPNSLGILDEKIKNIPLFSYNNRTIFSTEGISPKIVNDKYLFYFPISRIWSEDVMSDLKLVNCNARIFLSYKFEKRDGKPDEILMRNDNDLYARIFMSFSDLSIVFVCEKDEAPDYFELTSKRYFINRVYLRNKNLPFSWRIIHSYERHLVKLNDFGKVQEPYRYKDYLMGYGGCVEKILTGGELSKNFNELLYS